MVFDLSKVSGIAEYTSEQNTVGSGDDAEEITIYRASSSSVKSPAAKPFLILRKNTIELRTDEKLRDLLREKYESVMESRYFGRGGIEIVNSGQLQEDEISDLIRLSYNLSLGA